MPPNAAVTTLANPAVIVALDFANLPDALNLANQLDPKTCRLKVGKELFTRSGPESVSRLQELGFEIFLDLKFHDIPNTTAQAVLAAAELGVWMVNVHAAAGRAALTQSVEVLKQRQLKTKLIAVTVLTSMDDTQLSELNVNKTTHEQVLSLATLSQNCGLDGVVCSAQEASTLKSQIGGDFLLVTPGIRLLEDAADDQARICTPSDAIQKGSDYLVIGRSITKAKHPQAKLERILQSI